MLSHTPPACTIICLFCSAISYFPYPSTIFSLLLYPLRFRAAVIFAAAFLRLFFFASLCSAANTIFHLAAAIFSKHIFTIFAMLFPRYLVLTLRYISPTIHTFPIYLHTPPYRYANTLSAHYICAILMLYVYAAAISL